MIQATTALRKISRLRKRIWGIQGGQGAGKTFSILMVLINHAASVPNKEIYIASDELSKMRITVIKDFVKIMMLFNIFVRERWTDGVLYRFPNGSFVRFIGLDKEDIGKGLRSDVMFVNEANKVKFDTYRELTSRAKRVIIDFNPNKKFWFHTEVETREDCEFLKLTYLDNEFLSKEERNEILLYKEKGYELEGNGDFVLRKEVGEDGTVTYRRVIKNNYWANMWLVYGEGNIGVVDGRIYTFKKVPFSKYASLDKEEYIGNDWGKVDPWAVLGLKYSDGTLYAHELNYNSENEIQRALSETQLHQIRGAGVGEDGELKGLVAWKYRQFGIPHSRKIICDSNKPHKILSLRNAGWDYAISVGAKMDLKNRVDILNNLNICYTDTSTNLEFEQENYCYDKDKFGVTLETPVDQDNHLLDAMAYGVSHMFRDGIIKNI